MSTSVTTGLSKPEGSSKISLGTLGYMRARNRQRAYNLVIKEFKKSGLTQADLARRLGKAAEVVSRLLGRPRNWEMDTFSDLMFAISGAVPTYGVDYPLASAGAAIARTKIDPTRPLTGSTLPSLPALDAKLDNPNFSVVRFPSASAA